MYKLINFALFDTMLSQNHIIQNITYCTPLSGGRVNLAPRGVLICRYLVQRKYKKKSKFGQNYKCIQMSTVERCANSWNCKHNIGGGKYGSGQIADIFTCWRHISDDSTPNILLPCLNESCRRNPSSDILTIPE